MASEQSPRTARGGTVHDPSSLFLLSHLSLSLSPPHHHLLSSPIPSLLHVHSVVGHFPHLIEEGLIQVLLSLFISLGISFFHIYFF